MLNSVLSTAVRVVSVSPMTYFTDEDTEAVSCSGSPSQKQLHDLT